MFIFKYLLWPFAVLYDLVTRFRNYLYDIGHKKSFEFETVVISVGNLNVGGSGKTPMVEYLIRLLAERFAVATLSRGYGRKTHGIKISSNEDNAHSVGDEPYQLYLKFHEKIKVVVGEERALAIPTILNQFPEIEIILMDDAFQHRAVKPQFSILVTDYQKPFYTDYLLPFGRLRESRKGARRADVVVVTKADGSTSAERGAMKKNIQRVAGMQPVYFTGLSYNEPVPIDHSSTIGQQVILVSAIANNVYFASEISKRFHVVNHFRFEDHHVYSKEDIIRIHQLAESLNGVSILTTEKDMVKLIDPKLLPVLATRPWFYVPVQLEFLEDGTQFDSAITGLVQEKLAELTETKKLDTER